MARETLLDFFDDRIRSARPFLICDDGFRHRTWSYDAVRAAARRFAARLRRQGAAPGAMVVLWGENRAEWIAAFWGCLLARAVAVPLDAGAPPDLVARVAGIVDARVLVAGRGLPVPALPGVATWPLDDLLTEPAADGPAPAGTAPAEAADGPAPDGAAPADAVDGPAPAGAASAAAVDGPASDGAAPAAADGPAPDGATSAAPAGGPAADRAAPAGAERPDRGDLAEVIFTSGATAEPKGVRITHANVLANIVPVERETRKYAKYGRPFFPIRFLNLLPLSHLFGQAMATFVPPMIDGVTVFMRGHAPDAIVREIRTHRVSVLVSVPKILEVLRDYVLHAAPETAAAAAADGPAGSVARRWWRYRRVHRLLGFKFWAFVVGGAPLDPDVEAFWSRLGFLVIQGYGLTETAPIVTLNHPFRTRRGSVGAPIAGIEVRIADDGEILVRGDNVTEGYYGAPAETAAVLRDGWLHTGDVGALDAEGRLTIRGRKKEMIVTPDGLNVFPDDVERVVRAGAGVRDAAVVAGGPAGREHVHAVLLLDPGADADTVVREANARLADHQRVRARSVWSGAALPRTGGTRKLKRRAIKAWVDAGGGAPPDDGGAAADDDVAAVVAGFAHGRPVTAATTLDELGLSSIERIELLLALERRCGRALDDSALAGAATVADLRALVHGGGGADDAGAGAMAPSAGAAAEAGAATEGAAGAWTGAGAGAGAGTETAAGAGGGAAAPPGADAAADPAGRVDAAPGSAAAGGGADGAGPGRAARPDGAAAAAAPDGGAQTAAPGAAAFPRWGQGAVPRAVRRAALAVWLLPLARCFAWIRVDGLDRLALTSDPVLYAANHQSLMDGPVILAALPPGRRYRVATAAAREWFAPWFHPAGYPRRMRITTGLAYHLGVLFFNMAPLPQREAGAREAMRHLGTLLGEGTSVLIFPEGRRRPGGRIDRFQPGVGLLAARLRVPVVPVRIDGVDRVLPVGSRWARPGRVRVAFGAPIHAAGDDYAGIARRIEAAVKALGPAAPG